MSHHDLVHRALEGDIRSVSRLISLFEDRARGFEAAYAAIYPHTGRAHVIGITGPPGAGKSTLVDQIAGTLRQRGRKVGIVAIDPTSPYTGGAILGDRVRMQRHSTDDGVFIRSMGTRGRLGGVSRATSGAVDVLDAAGYDYVIVETVGVGQSEVEIASLADTVVLVQVPGLGDDIQVIKAGIMEIGDIFVVNKKDRPGADRTAAEIRLNLDMGYGGAGSSEWNPPIILTMGQTGEGIGELCDSCEAHMHMLRESGRLLDRRYRRAKSETMQIASEQIWHGLSDDAETNSAAEKLAWSVARRSSDPYEAGRALYELLVHDRRDLV